MIACLVFVAQLCWCEAVRCVRCRNVHVLVAGKSIPTKMSVPAEIVIAKQCLLPQVYISIHLEEENRVFITTSTRRRFLLAGNLDWSVETRLISVL